MDIKNIGAPAAERDDFLSTCFVDNNILSAVQSGKCFILLGNRGAGKSAIFQKLKETFADDESYYIEVAPEDYSYEMVATSLDNADISGWARQANFSAAWKHTLLTLALRLAKNRTPDTNGSDYKLIYKYLAQHYKQDRLDVVDELIGFIRRFKGGGVMGASADFSADATGALYRLEHLDKLCVPFKNLLEEGPITILVDELDRGWDASEQAKNFVAGLFQATIWLNQIDPRFRVLIALRRELYDNIPAIFEDAQKFRDVLKYVQWDEASLKEVAARRLQQAFDLPQGLSVAEQWASVFSETLNYRNTDSFNYIVDRTLYRPREIISFINDCLEKRSDSKDKIDYTTITLAESKYSQDRLQDIAAEYRFQFPDLDSVFKFFRGRVYRFSKDDLVSYISEIQQKNTKIDWLFAMSTQQVIDSLYEIGFLKALAIGGDKGKARSGSKWVGFYQNPQIDLLQIQSFQVHPMFRAALNMKEK